jgi:tetratricopeptide (TPR) repeat protein
MKLLSALAACALCMGAFAQPAPPAQSEAHINAILDEAAVEIWAQSDRYWHEGMHFRLMGALYMVIEMDPHWLEAYTNLGWLLESNHKDEAAVGTYLRCISLNPEAWAPYFDLGYFYYNHKQYDQALEPLVASTERKPTSLNPWRLLAHTYTKLGRLDDALRVWNRILETASDDPGAKHNQQEVRALIEAKASGEQPK